MIKLTMKNCMFVNIYIYMLCVCMKCIFVVTIFLCIINPYYIYILFIKVTCIIQCNYNIITNNKIRIEIPSPIGLISHYS